MKSRIYTTLLALILLSTGAVAQKVTFKGRITDENHNPIEIASVGVSGASKGTVADLNGNYIFTCESSDSIVLIYSMIGHQTRKRTFRNPTDTITVNIVLPSLGVALQEVEIVDKQKQMGSSQTIALPDQARLQPSASGNAIEDLIKSQAGVSSHNEMSSQYNVRKLRREQRICQRHRGIPPIAHTRRTTRRTQLPQPGHGQCRLVLDRRIRSQVWRQDVIGTRCNLPKAA